MPAVATKPVAVNKLQSKEMIVNEVSLSILWWTPPPFASIPTATITTEISERAEIHSYIVGTCGLDYSCTFTSDRSILSTTNVVLFTGSKLDEQDLPPAALRPSSQAWILNTVLDDPTEAQNRDTIISILDPTHTWSHSFQTANFVETVFQSSDDTYPQAHKLSFTPFLKAVTSPPKVDLQEKNRLRELGKEKGGRAAAVWITESNDNEGVDGGCVDALSGRENYVRELVQLMDVDIYGPCMNNTVWPVHHNTQLPYTNQEIMAEYKFVLALERVNCQDYVTQHLADALIVGAVPIVDGPKDYSRFSPTTDAFVQLSDYIAPEQLAQKIDQLDRNDTLYKERLSYRLNSNHDDQSGLIEYGLAPLFQQTFGIVSEPAISTPPPIPTTKVSTWSPDRHGVHCNICQLAHTLAQNTYNWTAYYHQREEKLDAAGATPACEPIPRYLPGLPAQMQAYDDFLKLEVDEAHLQQQQDMENIHQQQDTAIMKPNTVHVVNVTVSLNQTSFNPSGDSKDDSTQDQDVISRPSIVILHQDVNSPVISNSIGSQNPPESDSAVLHPNINNSTISSASTVKESDTMTLSPSELYYLLLLIIALFLGIGAIALILSKDARRKLFWPWRRFFYKKLPCDEQMQSIGTGIGTSTATAMSLERIMLRELGEDLLYD
ncbi:Alpha-(1,3)-fucosyltransferase 11 [Linnemannia zychae]|nr:Alpha-(1,3)-fucosyltransferase 11 [Linnemannia zychae]